VTQPLQALQAYRERKLSGLDLEEYRRAQGQSRRHPRAVGNCRKHWQSGRVRRHAGFMAALSCSRTIGRPPAGQAEASDNERQPSGAMRPIGRATPPTSTSYVPRESAPLSLGSGTALHQDGRPLRASNAGARSAIERRSPGLAFALPVRQFFWVRRSTARLEATWKLKS